MYVHFSQSFTPAKSPDHSSKHLARTSLVGITPEVTENKWHSNSYPGSSGDIYENNALAKLRRSPPPMEDRYAPSCLPLGRTRPLARLQGETSLAGITPESIENTGSRPYSFKRPGDTREN